MTGFAAAEGPLAPDGAAGDRGGGTFLWEARSVNNRGLDLKLRLPPGHDRLDPEVRRRVQAAFARGSLQLSLQTSRPERTTRYRVNEDQLALYVHLARRLEREHGLARPAADALLAMKGVLEPVEDEPVADGGADERLLASLDDLLAQLKAARRAEGARLAETLSGHIDAIAALVGEIERAAARVPARLHERLSRQLEELVASTAGLSVDRLHQEAALLATKADVREEIDRLHAHVAAARDLMAEDGPVGRRLDFLAQEFNREANTILSKAADPATTEAGLSLKARIEQMREQVQNVE